jgi:hypothetical protein
VEAAPGVDGVQLRRGVTRISDADAERLQGEPMPLVQLVKGIVIEE